jgi:hypothetical protein
MNLILVLNKTSPHAHMESELGVLGVHGKLVKYVVHSSKRKKLKKNDFSSHKLPRQQSTNFWSQGILGVKKKHVFPNPKVCKREGILADTYKLRWNAV